MRRECGSGRRSCRPHPWCRPPLRSGNSPGSSNLHHSRGLDGLAAGCPKFDSSGADYNWHNYVFTKLVCMCIYICIYVYDRIYMIRWCSWAARVCEEPYPPWNWSPKSAKNFVLSPYASTILPLHFPPIPCFSPPSRKASRCGCFTGRPSNKFVLNEASP